MQPTVLDSRHWGLLAMSMSSQIKCRFCRALRTLISFLCPDVVFSREISLENDLLVVEIEELHSRADVVSNAATKILSVLRSPLFADPDLDFYGINRSQLHLKPGAIKETHR